MAAIIGSARPIGRPVRLQLAGDAAGQLGDGSVEGKDLFDGDAGQEVLKLPRSLLLAVPLRDFHQRDSRERQDAVHLPVGDGVGLDRLVDRLEDFGVDVGVEEGLVQSSNARPVSSRRRR